MKMIGQLLSWPKSGAIILYFSKTGVSFTHDLHALCVHIVRNRCFMTNVDGREC